MARALGVGAIDAKDETRRFGINAFKILGVSYAVHRIGAVAARHGLVGATTGNHGRAVARVARQQKVPCTVFVPVLRTARRVEQQTRGARIEAMRQDGARVVEVDGTYEDAVRRAAAFGEESNATVVSDVSWDGYDQIPRWIMAGYTQLFEEARRQWESPPGLVLVQGGVGGLVCAAASWFAWRFGAARPYLVAAEPEHAACLLESARAGSPRTIDASLETIMAGLRCAAPSPAAWPAIAAGIDAFVKVTDARALDAMEMLRSADGSERIDAGPSGACGAAALIDIALAPELDELRSAARLDSGTRALVVITEGP
jgi:diaminopropionate ammonia-lyase